jgi:hypothetical protein
MSTQNTESNETIDPKYLNSIVKSISRAVLSSYKPNNISASRLITSSMIYSSLKTLVFGGYSIGM